MFPKDTSQNENSLVTMHVTTVGGEVEVDSPPQAVREFCVRAGGTNGLLACLNCKVIVAVIGLVPVQDDCELCGGTQYAVTGLSIDE